MKAYKAHLKDDEWMILLHGATREKAKWNFVKWNPEAADNSFYPDIRLQRLPEWDNKPFEDCQEIRELFLEITEVYDENGDGIYSPFINDCCCDLCREMK